MHMKFSKIFIILALVLSLAACKKEDTQVPQKQSVLVKDESAEDWFKHSQISDDIDEDDKEFIKNVLGLIGGQNFEEFSSSLSDGLRNAYGSKEDIKNSLKPFYEAGRLIEIKSLEKSEEDGQTTYKIISQNEDSELKTILVVDGDKKVSNYQINPYTFMMKQEDLSAAHPELIDESLEILNMAYGGFEKEFKEKLENTDLSDEDIGNLWAKLEDDFSKRGMAKSSQYQFIYPAIDKDGKVLEDFIQIYLMADFEEGDPVDFLLTFDSNSELKKIEYMPDFEN